MAGGQSRSQTHALAAAPLPGGTPRHTPTFKAFLLFPCTGKPHGLALGDQPGRQHPPANSCPAPASPVDPGLSPSWGPAPSARHEPRGATGAQDVAGPCWLRMWDWGRTGLGCHILSGWQEGGHIPPGSRSVSRSQCLPPTPKRVSLLLNCWDLTQINSLDLLYFFFFFYFAFAKKFGFCLKRFTFF